MFRKGDAPLKIDAYRVMFIGFKDRLHEGFRLCDLTSGKFQLSEGLAGLVRVHVGNESGQFVFGLIPSIERDIPISEHEPDRS